MVSAPDNNSGRDPRGRFAPGNPGGPGGSRRKTSELRRAALEAVTPDMSAGVMRKLTFMALKGDLGAIRLFQDRACGRAADVPEETEPLCLVLPTLRNAGDCAAATDRVLQALLRGDINRDYAQTLTELIQTRLKAIEMTDIEQHISDLQAQAKSNQASNHN